MCSALSEMRIIPVWDVFPLIFSLLHCNIPVGWEDFDPCSWGCSPSSAALRMKTQTPFRLPHDFLPWISILIPILKEVCDRKILQEPTAEGISPVQGESEAQGEALSLFTNFLLYKTKKKFL